MKNRTEFRNLSLKKGNAAVYSRVNGLSLQNLFYLKNGYFPNCYMFSGSMSEADYYFDTREILKQLTEKYTPKKWWQRLFRRRYWEYVEYRTYDFQEKVENLGINFALKKKNIYARIEANVSESYILYGEEEPKELHDIIEIVKANYRAPNTEENNLYLVAQDQGGFHLNKYQIKPPKNFDIAKQYNDEFAKADEIVCKFIEDKDKSGLVILHGEKGTGKTTYIRNIINKFPETKFVFVPSNMIRLLGEPAFGNFLMSLKNNVIILEDCEDVIRTRKSSSSSSSAVTLLLNMGDGLLSDDLGIKFICTFNENIQNIDDALLRKGRLACKYEFKELATDKANALLAEVYADRDPVPTTKKPMTLADIYNIDGETYINEKKTII